MVGGRGSNGVTTVDAVIDHIGTDLDWGRLVVSVTVGFAINLVVVNTDWGGEGGWGLMSAKVMQMTGSVTHGSG